MGLFPKGSISSISCGGNSVQAPSVSIRLITLTIKCGLYNLRLQGPQRVPGAREQCQTFDMGIIYVGESSTGLELVPTVVIENKSEA